MTIEDIVKSATQAIEHGTRMTLVVPRPWKNRPPKFPRGELLMIHEGGRTANYSFDPLNVLAWLTANGLVKMEPLQVRD